MHMELCSLEDVETLEGVQASEAITQQLKQWAHRSRERRGPSLCGSEVRLGGSQRGTVWPLRLHPKAANGQTMQRAFQKQLARQDVSKNEAY